MKITSLLFLSSFAIVACSNSVSSSNNCELFYYKPKCFQICVPDGWDIVTFPNKNNLTFSMGKMGDKDDDFGAYISIRDHSYYPVNDLNELIMIYNEILFLGEEIMEQKLIDSEFGEGVRLIQENSYNSTVSVVVLFLKNSNPLIISGTTDKENLSRLKIIFEEALNSISFNCTDE